MKLFRHKQKRRRRAAIAGTVFMVLSLSPFLLLFGFTNAFHNDPEAVLFALGSVLLTVGLGAVIFKLNFSLVTINEKGISSNVLYHKFVSWEECADMDIRKVTAKGAVIYYLYFSKYPLNEKQKKDDRSIRTKTLREGLIDIEYREEVLDAVWKYAPPDLIADLAEKLKATDSVKMDKSR